MKKLRLALGTGLGSGLLPFAPGTWGSIPIAVLAWFVLSSPYEFPIFIGLTVLFSALSFWSLPAVATENDHDPSKFVMDEWAGQALTYAGTSFISGPDTDLLLVLLLGFVAFRFFDILKPFGIDRLQAIPGPKGVLFDDLLAGLYANISMKTFIFIGFQSGM